MYSVSCKEELHVTGFFIFQYKLSVPFEKKKIKPLCNKNYFDSFVFLLVGKILVF